MDWPHPLVRAAALLSGPGMVIVDGAASGVLVLGVLAVAIRALADL
jgi:hypothetical protein